MKIEISKSEGIGIKNMCKELEDYVKESEKKGRVVWGSKKYDTDYQIRIVKEKWIPKLEKMIEEYKQESN